MTGRQHAMIGVGASLPVGTLLVTGALAGWPAALTTLPAWLMTRSAPVAGLIVIGLVTAGGLLGSVMPDLDSQQSLLESAPRRSLERLWRRRSPLGLVLAPILLLLMVGLAVINQLLLLLTRHRGLTHGLLALVGVTCGAALATGWAVGSVFTLGLAIGYASHLVADALTPLGIELGSPLSRRRWYLLPRPLRFGGETWRAEFVTNLVLFGGLASASWHIWQSGQ